MAQKKNEEVTKSRATKINHLFMKQKGIIGTYQKLADFKQPALILMRNGKRGEFYENATTGRFEYTHSNGEDMHIDLNRHFIQTLDYADREVQIYFCHEDYPFPLPHEPIITAEMKKLSDEKILNDYRKWTAEEYKAKGDMWWKILIGIAACGLVYMLIKMLTGGGEAEVAEPVKQTVTQVANATVLG